jgi:hypothetical protein
MRTTNTNMTIAEYKDQFDNRQITIETIKATNRVSVRRAHLGRGGGWNERPSRSIGRNCGPSTCRRR